VPPNKTCGSGTNNNRCWKVESRGCEGGTRRTRRHQRGGGLKMLPRRKGICGRRRRGNAGGRWRRQGRGGRFGRRQLGPGGGFDRGGDRDGPQASARLRGGGSIGHCGAVGDLAEVLLLDSEGWDGACMGDPAGAEMGDVEVPGLSAELEESVRRDRRPSGSSSCNPSGGCEMCLPLTIASARESISGLRRLRVLLGVHTTSCRKGGEGKGSLRLPPRGMRRNLS
jgi:hypothetical protein